MDIKTAIQKAENGKIVVIRESMYKEPIMQKYGVCQLLEMHGYKFHHKAYFRGYVSRKIVGELSAYEGRFGKGLILDCPNWNSTTYSFRNYYIKED